MAISAAEQYAIELLNRARLDPAAEAALYKITLNKGLKAGAISPTQKQALAPSQFLDKAATGHTSFMLKRDIFSHTGIGGSQPDDRMRKAGYRLDGAWSYAENIAFAPANGRDAVELIAYNHRQWILSPSHRVNVFGGFSQEIGLSQIIGNFRGNRGSMATQNFGSRGERAFVTGVAYNDTNGNNFYNIGEARRGVKIAVEGGSSANTAAAGGYGVVTPQKTNITISLGEAGALGRLSLRMTTHNVKLDLVQKGAEHWIFIAADTISTITLLDGIEHIRLLGINANKIIGSADAEEMVGNKGNNTFTGAGGNDTLAGADGNDTLLGGDGDDSLVGGNGNDSLNGGTGADALFGGTGRDTLLGGTGNDDLSGGNDADSLLGGDGDDFIAGDAGNDVLNGELGADTLDGGDGNDALNGGAGADDLAGGTGNDTLTGDVGNDLLNGEAGNDRLYGGADDDTLFGDTGNDSLDAGDGIDSLDGGDGHDTLLGGAGADTMEGGTGNDSLYGGDDADDLQGGSGRDRLEGEAGNDVLVGGAENDILLGGDGDDTLGDDTEELGNDLLNGGAGYDTLSGGDGDDTLIGGEGEDALTGGAGADRFEFDLGHEVDVIADFNGADGDRLVLTSALVGGRTEVQDVIDDFGANGAGFVYFNFGMSHIELTGIADRQDLLNYIIIL